MRSNCKINNENISRSDDIDDKTYYQSHEQINEVKYNLIIKIYLINVYLMKQCIVVL